MKKRFVSIWFRYLKTDWYTRRQPALRQKAFILSITDHGRMVVTEANAVALAQGIHSGMVVADARALFPGLQVLDEPPGLSEKLLSGMAAFCIRFTPIAVVDAPGGIILDVTGCTHLWGGDRPYLTDIYKRFQARGYDARLAMADTIGAAWAICRYGKNEKIILPGAHVMALRSLPPEALRLQQDVTERLYKLGLRNVGQLMEMPAASLRRRLGEDSMQRLRQAIGEEAEYIQPVVPVPDYQERLPCLEPIVTAAGIELALQQLLTLMCNRLQREQKGLRQVSLKCYRIEGMTEEVMIQTNRPSHHAEHLFKLLALKLPSIEPGLGIELFVLEALGVEEHIARQEWLWQTTGGLQDLRISELSDRIAVRIGAGNINRYLPDEHYWPERSVKKAKSLNETTEALWQTHKPRPLQLLPKPESITVSAPVPDYPPMSFRYKTILHEVARADGLERIEPEWWLQQGEHRDYYIVEDKEGRRYWIFRLGHYDAAQNNQWFLHGFFA